MDQKTIIKEWFESWVTKDFSKIEEYFIEDIYYRECYSRFIVDCHNYLSG